MAEKLGFKHFMTVNYRPGEDELTNYRAYKRRRGQGAGSNAEYSSTNSPEETDEALTPSQRLARARQARKDKSKLKMGRARASRRIASMAVLKRRARKSARKALYKKIVRGIPKSDLSPARKQEIEKRLEKPAFQARISRIARKTIKDVRKKELERKRK
jgi:hypothetical protein